MEPKIETKVKYDDRRKEFTQFMTTTQEIMAGEEVVGTSVTERKAVFKELGIRQVLSKLSNEKMKYEQNIKKIKDNLKDIPELTPRLKKLEQDLKLINDFNKAAQMKSQLEANEADLKLTKRDMKQIKDEIGTRLKL